MHGSINTTPCIYEPPESAKINLYNLGKVPKYVYTIACVEDVKEDSFQSTNREPQLPHPHLILTTNSVNSASALRRLTMVFS